MGGEANVAIDFVDTIVLAAHPPVDLLLSDAETWWDLQAARLPAGPRPSVSDAIELRGALRDAFEAVIADRRPSTATLRAINDAAAAAPSNPHLELSDEGVVELSTRWHAHRRGAAVLAEIAAAGMRLIVDEPRLRRCANPDCSMLFIGDNPRRIWCAANVCGNRTRVARHYRRTH